MAPTSMPMSFNVTGLAEPPISHVPHENPRDEQKAYSSDHWLPKVFSQSRPSTSFEYSAQSTKLFIENVPTDVAKPEARGYLCMAEFIFEDVDMLVGLYQRPESGKSGILCCTATPAGSKTESWEHLESLSISRSGPFLKIGTVDPQSEEEFRLWACIKFSDYEGMFIKLLYLAMSSIATTI